MRTSSSLSNLVYELRALGNVCHSQGDLVRAEQHYRLALSLYESSFPDRHEDAILCLLGLVQVLDGQGKHTEARQFESTVPALNARRRGT